MASGQSALSSGSAACTAVAAAATTKPASSGAGSLATTARTAAGLRPIAMAAEDGLSPDMIADFDEAAGGG